MEIIINNRKVLELLFTLITGGSNHYEILVIDEVDVTKLKDYSIQTITLIEDFGSYTQITSLKGITIISIDKRSIYFKAISMHSTRRNKRKIYKKSNRLF